MASLLSDFLARPNNRDRFPCLTACRVSASQPCRKRSALYRQSSSHIRQIFELQATREKQDVSRTAEVFNSAPFNKQALNKRREHWVWVKNEGTHSLHGLTSLTRSHLRNSFFMDCISGVCVRVCVSRGDRFTQQSWRTASLQ